MPNRELVIWANKTGAALLPDNDQWTNRFEIKSETSSRKYVIAQRKTTKEWSCGCPGNKRWRSSGTVCKHLRAVKPTLERICA